MLTSAYEYTCCCCKTLEIPWQYYLPYEIGSLQCQYDVNATRKQICWANQVNELLDDDNPGKVLFGLKNSDMISNSMRIFFICNLIIGHKISRDLHG